MKSIKLIMFVLMAVSLLALSAAEIDGIYVWKSGNYTRFNLNDISFSDNKICIDEATMSVDAIDSITFTKPTEAYVVTDTILIDYRGAVASVSPQNVEGLTTEVNGAAVHITNTNADHEMTFVLSGKSNEGSFTYYGDYKASIRLAGVSLESSTGAALDIKCGKRIALELADGTDNCLKDASEDLGQKAALYCKGHMEVSGGGSLTVNGKVSHAISTKEYMLVKKDTGTIHVIAAEGDGIHVGQYFQMNGGTINIQMTGSGGKGIKCDGNLTIGISDDEGPVLNVSTTGTRHANSSSAKAIKVDGAITVNGGESIIQTSTLFAEGLESKLKSDASIVFNGGRHYFRCNNDCISTVGAIKFDGGIVVCYSSGDDAVDSNYGRKGAIQIGNGIVLAYSSYNSNGGFDSDNSSFIQITGNGIAIGGGANSFGNNPEASIIENAAQGYCFTASPLSYTQNRYYTLADEDGNNLVTYSVEANFTSALSFFTATGMKSGSSYTVWESQAKPTDATTEWHSIYLGSNTTGTNIVTSFTAK